MSQIHPADPSADARLTCHRYFQGVLLLTTNRGKCTDNAYNSSKIHFKLTTPISTIVAVKQSGAISPRALLLKFPMSASAKMISRRWSYDLSDQEMHRHRTLRHGAECGLSNTAYCLRIAAGLKDCSVSHLVALSSFRFPSRWEDLVQHLPTPHLH